MRARFMLSVISVGVAVAQIPPHAAASQFVTVGTMLENCESDRTSAAWGVCVGYVGAMTDHMASIGFQSVQSDSKPAPNEAICPDADNDDFSVTVPLFVDWAQHHPEKQNLPAYLGVGFALQEKWPCRS
jgi:hypothetical protein